MDWDQLRVFLAVARTGRVSVAARQLNVKHTTVSRRLAVLERELSGGKRLRIEAPDDLARVPLLAYAPQLGMLQRAPWFQPILNSARVLLETNSTQTLLAAAQACLGVAVLPRFVAAREEGLLQ